MGLKFLSEEEQIHERGKIVVAIETVHIVVNGDEADSIAWEYHPGVLPDK